MSGNVDKMTNQPSAGKVTTADLKRWGRKGALTRLMTEGGPQMSAAARRGAESKWSRLAEEIGVQRATAAKRLHFIEMAEKRWGKR